MQAVDWYFDFVSPFAYLASQRLGRLPDDVVLRPRPALFGAILGHWKTLGPAEIEPMRRFTFRHVTWIAVRDGIELRLPPAHPFNPLPLLRLCTALDATPEVVDRLFRFVWAEGGSADDPGAWAALLDELGVDESRLSEPGVKARLRESTDAAIAAGAFGVPTFAVDGELFWGYDALEFLAAYLGSPDVLRSPAMREADAMPVGLQRRGNG